MKRDKESDSHANTSLILFLTNTDSSGIRIAFAFVFASFSPGQIAKGNEWGNRSVSIILDTYLDISYTYIYIRIQT